MAQLRAGPPQVVRRNVLQACSLAAGSDHVPDNVLREAAAPHLSPAGDRSKDFALTNPSGSCPLIESGFHPVRNGHCANVATFANQINHGPVSLAHLDVVQLQTDQFRPAKATTEQHGQHRIIAFGAHSVSPRILEHFRTLLRAQPITRPESELLDSLDATNPRGQLGTQQASVGGFVSQATHGCKLLVDGVGGQMPRFQVHAIAHDDAVEGQPRFGTVPRDELVDGVLVDSARSWRAEAIENCRFTMIQVWQTEHSATIVRLDSRFAHDNGLQCRSSRNTVSSARVQARIARDGTAFLGVPKPANVGVRPWASAIPRFKRRCSDRDGHTRSKSKAGRSGNGSCTDCRTVRFASPNHKLENFNERYRLLAEVDNLCASRSGIVGRSPRCYCSFAYSALASFRMGMSGSASFHMAKNCS